LKNKYFKKKNIAAMAYFIVAGSSLYWLYFSIRFFPFLTIVRNTYDWWILFSAIISVYTGIILLFFEQYFKKNSKIIIIPLCVNIFIGIIVMVESFFEAFPLTIPILICHYSLLKSMKKLVSH
jgi:hypothetical protein